MKSRRPAWILVATSLTVWVCCSIAQAQPTNGNGVWNRNGLSAYHWAPPTTGPNRNWWGQGPGNYPSGVNATATLTNNITANQSVDLQSHNIVLRTLNIGDSNGSHQFSIDRTGTGTLTIGSSAGSGAINSSNGTNTISVPLQLGNSATLQHTTAAGSLAVNGPVNNNGNTLSVSGAGNTAIAGAISGSGGLLKQGAGNLTLSRANTFSGATKIASGSLILTDGGSLANSSGIHVASGAVLNASALAQFNLAPNQVLSGGGTFLGNLGIFAGGVLAPGASPGAISVDGDLTLGGGGVFDFEINDALGIAGSDPGWDLAQVSGALLISADSLNPFSIDVRSLSLANTPGSAVNFDEQSNYSWTILTATGGISGFSSSAFIVDSTQFANSATGMFSVSVSGNNLLLNYFAPIPEPGSGLVLAGAAILLILRRRAKRCQERMALSGEQKGVRNHIDRRTCDG